MKFVPAETFNGRWLVGFDFPDWVVNNGIVYDSSYHVVGARLMGLTYPQYLDYLKSCGGVLKGRAGYPYAYFTDKKICEKICKELNERWKILERSIVSPL